MTVLKRPSNKESMGFITNVSVFGQVTVWGAVNEYEPVIFGDEWKNHFKVLFYLWIVTDAFRDMPEIRSRAARYMSDVMFPLSQDESQKAACDVARVTFNGDGSHQAIRTICHILAEEAMDHQLHYTWSITLLLLTATPANFFKSPVDIANNADLFHSTLQAMQRQVCCGTESNNKYNVLPVLVSTF
ncbi:hypothetical protein K474DRAFT_1709505 [Panus rudis PR-1116 ss-1]|nr:hypothetical protein K474DRAFT_1709505 [Panus rudis PR-1116 ss-1]